MLHILNTAHVFSGNKGEKVMHISEFQRVMRHIYFHRDSKRGIEETFDRFTDEVKELGQALRSDDTKEIEGEFADVIAWLTSVANLVNVDVEESVLEKYGNVCPRCKHSPCKCAF